jgi:hydrogenase maturation protease
MGMADEDPRRVPWPKLGLERRERSTKERDLILIIGVGNPTRRDDGAGPEVVRRLESLALHHVELRSATQLDTTLAVDLVAYDKVLVVEADPNAEEVRIELAPDETGLPSTPPFHPLGLEGTRAVHAWKDVAEVWVCRVPAKDFEFGEVFSPVTEDGIRGAVEAARRFVEGDGRDGKGRD